MIISGEDDPSLSQSSMLRCITVVAEATSYNGELLRAFQQDGRIMQNYFALYIEFLREREDEVITFIQGSLACYRQRYKEIIEMPRLRDAAINLMLVTELIRRFAKWCGADSAAIRAEMDKFDETILNAVLSNQDEKSSLKPHVMFVYALMQSIGTKEKNGIAETEAVFEKNESGYLGFYEAKTDTLWLRHEEADLIVKRYWEQQGKAYTVTPQKVRKLLYDENVSEGTVASNGKLEYLRRAKRGNRKHMLVLRQSQIQKIMDDVNK